MTEGVSAGILQAMERGSVTSTSAMTCVPGAVSLLQRYGPRLVARVGVHLQLTDGKPLLPAQEVPSLTGSGGRFPRSRRELGSLNSDEIWREWQTQVQVFTNLGLTPTHFDTHRHVHKEPLIFELFLAIAQRYRLPARATNPAQAAALRSAGVPCAGYCQTSWYGKPTLESLIESLSAAWRMAGASDSVELMCHPGQVDAELQVRSVYVAHRQLELDILRSAELSAYLQRQDIRLIGMSALNGPA